MAIKAPKMEGNGKKADPIEPGTYPGRLVQVIELGLQPQRPFKGEEKQPAYEIYTTYELSDEFMKDDEGNDLEDKPRWLSENFPFYSLSSDKAKSTKRYLALDPDAKYDGDWEKVINTPVMVTISKDKSKKDPDKVFNNISSTQPMRSKEADKLPGLKNPPKIFSLSDPDITIFKSLPQWLQDKITKDNLEFNGSPLEKLLQGHGDDSGSQGAKKEDGPSEDESEAPEVKDEEEDW